MRHQSQYQCYIDSTNTYFNWVPQNQNQINHLRFIKKKGGGGFLFYFFLTLEILRRTYKIIPRGILWITLFTIRLRTYPTYSIVTINNKVALFFLSHKYLLRLFKLQGKFNSRVSTGHWFFPLQLKDKIFGVNFFLRLMVKFITFYP